MHAPVGDAASAHTAAQVVWANPHVPAGPGTERAAAADRGAADGLAWASVAAGRAAAAETAWVAVADTAAKDGIPRVAVGPAGGETCGGRRYLPMPGALLPGARAVPDAVAGDAGAEAVDLVAADTLPDLVAPHTRVHVRVVAH